MTRRRVAVTGLGVVSSLGCGLDLFWRRCLEGATVVKPIPERWRRYWEPKSRVWSPLGDWRRSTPLLTRIERRRMDPAAQIAVQAAAEALGGAEIELEPMDDKRNTYRIPTFSPERTAVFMGTGIGGLHSTLSTAACHMLTPARQRLRELGARRAEEDPELVRELERVLEGLPAPQVFNPFAVTMSMPNAVAANLAVKLGFRGPARTLAGACASGTIAVGKAFRAIRDGECDAALTGGTEFLSDDYGSCFRGFDAVGALADGDLPPEAVNRPFDEDRSGFLFAEGGAAVLILEELRGARERGAPVLAEVTGYGETCDGHDLMAMEPSGAQVRRAVEACLADAGLAAADVGYVNAHGTGTESNDPLECGVIEEIFDPGVAVGSTKSLLGHTLGASGALEAVVTVSALREETVPPTRGLERPIADLRFVTRADSLSMDHALSQSFAFGGHNAVVAFGRPR